MPIGHLVSGLHAFLWQFAGADEKLEELQMAYQVGAITSSVLIPVSELKQGSSLLWSEAALGQRLCFPLERLRIHSSIC
jgi:hypothetical protein